MPRPKLFNPDEVLDKAMHVFWQHGYRGTTIQDLTEAMGINRCSLYDTFGDKHALFLQTLDLFFETQVEKNMHGLIKVGDDEPPLVAIGRFFEQHIEGGQHAQESCRCLYQRVASEVAPDDPAVRERIQRLYDRLHGLFTDLLTRARQRGELAGGVRIPDAAWSLVILLTGITALDAAPPPAKAIRAMLRQVLDGLRAEKKPLHS